MNSPAWRIDLKARLEAPPAASVEFGYAEIDAALGGGLAPGAHQAAGEGSAALGFALMLLAKTLRARPGGRGLLVQAGDAAREAGRAYAPGLQALGLGPDRVGLAAVRSGAEALRIVDEALKSGAVAAVVADLWQEPRLDLSVTRRFNLAGRRAGTLAMLATRDLDGTSAALTRWQVAPHPSRGRRRRLGRPAFDLALTRNRFGPTGAWTLEWDSDDHAFRPLAPLSAPLARPAVDRSGEAHQPRRRLAAGAGRQGG